MASGARFCHRLRGSSLRQSPTQPPAGVLRDVHSAPFVWRPLRPTRTRLHCTERSAVQVSDTLRVHLPQSTTLKFSLG